jgi:hypothetical protein
VKLLFINIEMKRNLDLIIAVFFLICNGCTVFERSSMHGFESGFYHFKSDSGKVQKIYLDIEDDSITAYPTTNKTIDKTPVFGISLLPAETLGDHPEKFGKRSIDIDITTILFKYRPGKNGLPAQLTTDFNAAMFVGWRHDNYLLESMENPLRHDHYEAVNRGFDVGVFAGPGTTPISPFSTKEMVLNEYSGMIIQYGIAGFVESSVASFGIAAGFDYLLSPDRKVWIYNKKPWIGFVVGIALN